jgi:hypothetical protein
MKSIHTLRTAPYMMDSLAIGLLWTLFPLFHLTFAQKSGYITSKPVSRFYISEIQYHVLP